MHIEFGSHRYSETRNDNSKASDHIGNPPGNTHAAKLSPSWRGLTVKILCDGGLDPSAVGPFNHFMTGNVKDRLKMRAELVENWLRNRFSQYDGEGPAIARLGTAIAHGALGGGKRLRPFLVMEAAEMLRSEAGAEALPAACAIEMIHCYSLIHDDLPAMDDADTRRGRPSVHVAFDEAIAVLAGDGLLTDAFTVLTEGPYEPHVSSCLVHTLSLAAGTFGMVGGQMMDLFPDGVSEKSIIDIQRRKTGALIEAAAVMGGQVAQANDEDLTALKEYARAIGLAFQIVDDVLDVTQSAEAIGKPVGADDAAGKATFVSLLGVDGAKERVNGLTTYAHNALDRFGDRATCLRDLADSLSVRTT